MAEVLLEYSPGILADESEPRSGNAKADPRELAVSNEKVDDPLREDSNLDADICGAAGGARAGASVDKYELLRADVLRLDAAEDAREGAEGPVLPKTKFKIFEFPAPKKKNIFGRNF